MNDELNNLEREVEAAESGLPAAMRVDPSAATVERVKCAVRQELNETWLAQHSSPQPTAETLASVRRAVRMELAGSDRSRRIGAATRRFAWQSFWRRAAAPLAAAAMIVIGVGITHRSRTSESGTPTAKLDPVDVTKMVVEIEEAIPSKSSSIVTAIDSLQTEYANWKPAVEDTTDELGQIMREIDEYLAQEKTPGKTSGLRSSSERTIG